MSFLTLNGYTVPIIKAQEIHKELGSRDRVFSGAYNLARRATKRSWQFQTLPLKEVQAELLKGMIRGAGQYWAFDSDEYSSKGVGTTSAAVHTIRSANAADGDPVYDENGIAEAKYGDGATAVEPATTNLLAADSRDAENAPTGYTAFMGASLSASTTHYWQGSKSLKVVTDAVVDASPDGARASTIDPGAGSATKTYIGTVYLKGDSGGEQVDVNLYDQTNGAYGSGATKTLTNPDTWYRVSVSITIGGIDCRAMKLYVDEHTSGSNITYYCDGWQIELQPTNWPTGMPTSWVDGARGGSGNLAYPINLVSVFNDWTIAGWAKSDTINPVISTLLAKAYGDGKTLFGIGRDSAANNIRFRTTDTAGNINDITYATTPWDDDWHHVVATLRRNPESGEHKKELFFDGTSVGNADPSGLPDLSTTSILSIGAQSNSFWWTGALDGVQMLPYAVDAAWVAAEYALGVAAAGLPRIIAAGDFITESSINVIGELHGIDYVKRRQSGTWRNNMRSIGFVLHEV